MSLPVSRRALVAGALAPLLLTGFAACGSGSGDSTASTPKSSASATASPSGTGTGSGSDATGTVELAGLKTGDTVEPSKFIDIVASGSKKATTARLTMKTTAAGTAVNATSDVDYTTTPVSMKTTMDMGAVGTGEVIYAGGMMYLKIDSVTKGKYWKIDPTDPTGPLAGIGLDKTLTQADPVAGLESLRSALTAVTFKGDETVSGQQLGHYVLTLDTKAAMSAGGISLPSGAAAGTIPDSITYDLWLDSENRFAKMKMDVKVAGQDSLTEITVSNWGEPVTIKAPPASKITAVPDLSAATGTAAS